jgi:hypothetical protein
LDSDVSISTGVVFPDGPHLLEHLGAVHDRHGDVQDHQVIDAGLELLEALLAVLGLVGLEPELLDLLHHDRSDRAAVVDSENAGHFPIPPGSIRDLV